MAEKLVFTPFVQEDVATCKDIMKRAFDEDTRRSLGEAEGGPEGYDDGSFLQKWYVDSKAIAYKATLNGRPVGACNAFLGEDGQAYLGNIFVDPCLQDQGIGLQIWQYLEASLPNVRVWTTETPGFSGRNHHFYVNKCGFHVIRIDNPKDPMESSFVLEKRK